MLYFLNKRQASTKQRLFSVPQPDPFENPMVETNPGQLRQWAAGLPFANPEQLAEAVIISLVRLNRYPAPVKKREELMEIYRTPSSRLYHIALERKSALPARLNRQVMLEMAYGYLHLVNQSLAERPSARRRKQLQAYIYFAVKYLSLEYLHACLMYDCHGSVTLKELVRLHTLAEELDLQHESKDDPEHARTTISHQTKLALLLSLLDPCHLQEDEPRIVYQYLNEFADSARFIELTSQTETTGHYVIDRLSEVPPQPFDPSRLDGLATPRFCLFNILPISQRLHQDLRVIEKQGGGNPAGLQNLGTKTASNLLRRMLKSWHIRMARDSERHTTSGRSKLSLGIQSIHHFLTGAASPPELDSDIAEEIALNLETGGLNHSAPPTFRTLDCWRFNQSRSGVAVLLSLPQASIPQVGELILLTKPDDGNRGEAKIGIVRRVLLKDPTILEVGVQFINGRIVPLSMQPLDMPADQTPPSITALYIDQGTIERSSLIARQRHPCVGSGVPHRRDDPRPERQPGSSGRGNRYLRAISRQADLIVPNISKQLFDRPVHQFADLPIDLTQQLDQSR